MKRVWADMEIPADEIERMLRNVFGDVFGPFFAAAKVNHAMLCANLGACSVRARARARARVCVCACACACVLRVLPPWFPHRLLLSSDLHPAAAPPPFLPSQFERMNLVDFYGFQPHYAGGVANRVNRVMFCGDSDDAFAARDTVRNRNRA